MFDLNVRCRRLHTGEVTPLPLYPVPDELHEPDDCKQNASKQRATLRESTLSSPTIFLTMASVSLYILVTGFSYLSSI